MDQSGRPHAASRLNVFLSYRSVEAKFADVLSEHLRRDFIGLVHVFLASDTTSVPAGTLWLSEVIEGLRQSHFHIVVCSSESVRRPWINYEAGAARVRDVPIVPVCHSGLTPAQLPVPLSESEGGTFTDGSFLRKLYGRIAVLLGSSVPEVDFDVYAKEFAELEAELRELEPPATTTGGSATLGEPERVDDPSVLCVTSEQFKALGIANQLELVLNAFPTSVKHQTILNSRELRRILAEERIDIVHIAAFVCPRGGDLYFSPVELPLGKSTSEDTDLLTPDALVALLTKARTKLVVLGGSASLVLAAELLPVTNVIAVRDVVSPKAMASWVETFYDALLRESLASACELATRVSQAPMKFYVRQCGTSNIQFRRRE